MKGRTDTRTEGRTDTPAIDMRERIFKETRKNRKAKKRMRRKWGFITRSWEPKIVVWGRRKTLMATTAAASVSPEAFLVYVRFFLSLSLSFSQQNWGQPRPKQDSPEGQTRRRKKFVFIFHIHFKFEFRSNQISFHHQKESSKKQNKTKG